MAKIAVTETLQREFKNKNFTEKWIK